MPDHAQTVQQIYEAFGRGDVPAIVERLAPDVAWESWDDNSAQRAGVSHLVARRGRDEVPDFFAEVAKLDVRGFEVLDLLASERQVAAEVRIETASFSDEELHLWTFGDDGLVSRFRHYVYTAKHIAAARDTVTSGA
jgi:ketosteroid isomerase-like protein